MGRDYRNLGQILVSHRLISEAQLARALDMQRERDEPIGKALVRLGYASESQIVRVLAAQLGVSPWDLEAVPPEPEVRALLPDEICERHSMIPAAMNGERLVLAMSNPLDASAIDAAYRACGMRIEPVLAGDAQIERALAGILPARGRTRTMDSLVGQAAKEGGNNDFAHQQTALDADEGGPIAELANQLLADAIRQRASDVHIEPRHDGVDVRYRIDGEMSLARELPSSVLSMIAARVKILAELDVVETRLPQDGRITVAIDGRDVDVRVSVLPSYHGPRIVMRVLDRSASLRGVEDLGMSAEILQSFRASLARPYGLFIVTGPTGSGKTTSLYAALSEIRKVTRNIMTCEDPVEYDIDGVSQTQGNEKFGLTFPIALRSTLRQDPDVIMVGEMRDRETAETAIRAALTGHLVLTTLHCNDAPSAIPRLLEMGVDPYLLSSCLAGTSSQRLLRSLCPKCRVPSEESFQASFPESFGISKVTGSLYRAVGCARCRGTGYVGRFAVHEIMSVSPKLANAIAGRAPVEVIRQLAAESGYQPMSWEVARAVLEGRTTMSEAQRLVCVASSPGGSRTKRAA